MRATNAARYVRDEDLYFDDGSVVLRGCGSSPIFRVHLSILAKRCSFFQDLRHLAQPDAFPDATYEGLPMVSLDDDPEDIKHYILAIYYPDTFRPPPEETESFRKLEGVLRIAHKYGDDNMRARGLRHLAQIFVPEPMYPTYSTGPKEYGDVCGPEDLVRRVGQLARDVDALWLLPNIFLHAFVYRVAEDADAVRHSPKRSHAMLPEYLHNHKQAQATVLSSWIEGCFARMPRQCVDGVDECTRGTRDGLLSQARIARYVTGDSPLADSVSEDHEKMTVQYSMCEGCARHIERCFSDWKAKTWNEFPNLFGLPDWVQLHMMHARDREVSDWSFFIYQGIAVYLHILQEHLILPGSERPAGQAQSLDW
ncbi:hypothetical protein HDZ31DRAFT_30775 [Schizophyllum fasciatum]